MRARASWLCAAALVVTACRSAAPADRAATAHSTKDDERAIAAVIAAQESAWNAGDVEGYMRAGYWQSDALTFFSGGDVTRGYAPVAARYVRRYKSEGAEMGHLTFADLETRVLADGVALVRGHWQLDFAAKQDAGGLFTLLLERHADGWRIVHDHTSVATP